MVGQSTIEPVHLVGIDCAVDPKRIGLAHAVFSNATLQNLELLAPRASSEIVDWIAERVRGAQRALFAMDSPLGWPAALGQTLAHHSAGAPVSVSPDELFRRLTDHVVRERIGKQPLEVGADRIARTAVAALRLLDDLGHALGRTIPLAWDPYDEAPAGAIETYPAAWLLGRGLPADRYKYAGAEALSRREEIVWTVAPLFAGGIEPGLRSQLTGSSHLLDAIICALCAADFLMDRCRTPRGQEREQALKEGWIWFPDLAGR